MVMFKFIKNPLFGIGMIFLCAFLAITFVMREIDHSQEKERMRAREMQNAKALNDTITEIKTKQGETISYKNALIVDKDKEIKEYSESLEKARRDIARYVSEKEIKTIIKTEVEYVSDTVYIEKVSDVKIENGVFSYIWNHKDKWRYIQGKTAVMLDTSLQIKHLNTAITNNEIYFNVVTGTYIDKDGYEKIFVKTDNPYLILRNMEGAILDDRRRRRSKFQVSINGGFGLVYDMSSDEAGIGYGPYVGFGVSYSPFGK